MYPDCYAVVQSSIRNETNVDTKHDSPDMKITGCLGPRRMFFCPGTDLVFSERMTRRTLTQLGLGRAKDLVKCEEFPI